MERYFRAPERKAEELLADLEATLESLGFTTTGPATNPKLKYYVKGETYAVIFYDPNNVEFLNNTRLVNCDTRISIKNCSEPDLIKRFDKLSSKFAVV